MPSSVVLFFLFALTPMPVMERKQGYLRCKPPWVCCCSGAVVACICVRLDHTAEVEVRDFDSPVPINQQVGGLEVPVQDGVRVAVKL